MVSAADRPDFVVSQYHGDCTAMSWFLVVHDGFKLVVWGSGQQHPHQLFDLVSDPSEATNLIDKSEHAQRVELLLTKLKSVVDFPAVAQNVAKYNYDSLKFWTSANSNWPLVMGKSNLWHESWSADPQGAVAAVNSFLAKPPQVEVCRKELIWPIPSVEVSALV